MCALISLQQNNNRNGGLPLNSPFSITGKVKRHIFSIWKCVLFFQSHCEIMAVSLASWLPIIINHVKQPKYLSQFTALYIFICNNWTQWEGNSFSEVQISKKATMIYSRSPSFTDSLCSLLFSSTNLSGATLFQWTSRKLSKVAARGNAMHVQQNSSSEHHMSDYEHISSLKVRG